MGWWSRTDDAASADNQQQPTPPLSAIAPQVPSSDAPDEQHTTPPTNPLTPPRVLGRDAAAYEELKSLFAQIDPERASTAASTAAHTIAHPEEERESFYSSKMSCSQCFDLAYYCSSAGGQLNNVYRYGALRSCSDLWAQWRFCMRTKAMGEETKRRRVREFNQEKAAKYKVGRSSEDIWEVRTEPVENAFSRRLGKLEEEEGINA